ncbi:hypothetical protein PsAD26_04974 [Pseudovibrio sp. Ad26]|nr:hypothetical protein PsAD26_04974 [Pseudovibrio sp. Ad26]
MTFLRIIVTTFAILIGTSNTYAEPSTKVARELGLLIASEEICLLTYSLKAISDYVTKHVPPNDMEFADNLRRSIRVAKHDINTMAPSEVTAHCTQIIRSALYYEFID